MNVSLRRVWIALGALVEAGLIMWLLQGFVPAGFIALLLTLVLGGLIYQDVVRRETPSRDIRER